MENKSSWILEYIVNVHEYIKQSVPYIHVILAASLSIHIAVDVL